MKSFKKSLYLILILSILILPVTAQASSRSKAMRAYKHFMATKKDYESFAVAYVDNNSIPDLACGGNLYTYSVSRNTVVPISKGFNAAIPYSYYKKKCVIIFRYVHANIHGVTNNYTVYKFAHKKLTEKYGKLTYKDADTGEKTRGYFRITPYQDLSKSSYKRLIRKKVGSASERKFRYYQNTSSNRRKVFR